MNFIRLPSKNVFVLCPISKTFLFEKTNTYYPWRGQIDFLCWRTSVMACLQSFHFVCMLDINKALVYKQSIIWQKSVLVEIKQFNLNPFDFDSENIFFIGHTSLDPVLFSAISLP
jgi:hypothetical protein